MVAYANKITLTGGYGKMHECRKPAVIRFRKCNKDADASNCKAYIVYCCNMYAQYAPRHCTTGAFNVYCNTMQLICSGEY